MVFVLTPAFQVLSIMRYICLCYAELLISEVSGNDADVRIVVTNTNAIVRIEGDVSFLTLLRDLHCVKQLSQH
jgi:hypothetical protein